MLKKTVIQSTIFKQAARKAPRNRLIFKIGSIWNVKKIVFPLMLPDLKVVKKKLGNWTIFKKTVIGVLKGANFNRKHSEIIAIKFFRQKTTWTFQVWKCSFNSICSFNSEITLPYSVLWHSPWLLTPCFDIMVAVEGGFFQRLYKNYNFNTLFSKIFLVFFFCVLKNEKKIR